MAEDASASSSDAEDVGVVSGAAPVGGQGIGRVGRLLWISREVLGINVSVWFESDGRVRRNGIGSAIPVLLFLAIRVRVRTAIHRNASNSHTISQSDGGGAKRACRPREWKTADSSPRCYVRVAAYAYPNTFPFSLCEIQIQIQNILATTCDILQA